MSKPHAGVVMPRVVAPVEAGGTRPAFPRALVIAVTTTCGVFAFALAELFAFSRRSELYSYIPLIPLISLYLAWQIRGRVATPGPRARGLGVGLIALGLGLYGVALAARNADAFGAAEDRLAVTTLAFVIALAGACACALSRGAFRALLFPLCFLAFASPWPDGMLHAVETFMQHGSAFAARALFELTGTPVFYDQLNLQLPGIVLHVARECSGIRSTLVLAIVSVLTSYYFLRTPTRRALLVAVIVPLALARNGLRIFVIGELCVRIGPQMIDSFIHRQGGPFFFVASLVPLFCLLRLLQRQERRAHG